MPKLPELPELNQGEPLSRSLKKVSGIKKLTKEATVYHMAVYDMDVIDALRKKGHEFYFLSRRTPDALIDCFESLRQMYVVFKYAFTGKLRQKIDKQLDTLQEEITAFEFQKQIPLSKHRELRKKIFRLMEDLYQAKQIIGLGMPKEKVQDAETRLEDALNG